MPNLVITNSCNLTCPFCFASEYRAEGDDRRDLSGDEVGRLVDYCGVDAVRFCGGEPTLHPAFLDLLARALAPRSGRAFVMTNGLWPEAVARGVAALPAADSARITYLINVLPHDLYTDAQRARLFATLGQLPAEAVTLGVTLFDPHQDLSLLFELSERFGAAAWRYGIAAPNVTDPRSWRIEPERDFVALGELVHRLVRRARQRGIPVHSDCAYVPPCKLSAAAEADLAAPPGAPVQEHRCHGPVDIGAGGQAWRCFGLYALLRAPLADFANAAELDHHFERLIALGASAPLFPECVGCRHASAGRCGGGCHAFRAVADLRRQGRAAGLDVADDEALLQAAWRIDGEHLRRLEGRAGRWLLRDVDETWVDLRPDALEAALLDGIARAAAVPREPAARRAAQARALRRLLLLGALAAAEPPGER